MHRNAGRNGSLTGKRRSFCLVALVVLALVAGVFTLAACGTDGGQQPTPILAQEQASELALSYAREQGLFGAEGPISTTVVTLTVAQARQQQTANGFADPFAALSPPPSEGTLVAVVTLVEELILPTPNGEGTLQARSVVVIIDDASRQVLWAERREPDAP